MSSSTTKHVFLLATVGVYRERGHSSHVFVEAAQQSAYSTYFAACNTSSALIIDWRKDIVVGGISDCVSRKGRKRNHACARDNPHPLLLPRCKSDVYGRQSRQCPNFGSRSKEILVVLYHCSCQHTLPLSVASLLCSHPLYALAAFFIAAGVAGPFSVSNTASRTHAGSMRKMGNE